MSIARMDLPPVFSDRRALEVVVCDADHLLDDACKWILEATADVSPLLTSRKIRSLFVQAIDHRVIKAVMSERAFLEIGWMYPKAARGNGVGETILRALIEREYLPRIPVVLLPNGADGFWGPRVIDIDDPDDVEHAQLAQFVSATAVYSHDKDLRKPGYAPRDRKTFNERLEHISQITDYAKKEQVITFGVRGTGAIVFALVDVISRSLQIKKIEVWLGLAFASAVGLKIALEPLERRHRFGVVVEQMFAQLSVEVERHDRAMTALITSRLIRIEPNPRLEIRLASYLVRYPGLTITEMRRSIGVNAPSYKTMRETLESHPSFVETRPCHWMLGSFQTTLSPERRSLTRSESL